MKTEFLEKNKLDKGDIMKGRPYKIIMGVFSLSKSSSLQAGRALCYSKRSFKMLWFSARITEIML